MDEDLIPPELDNIIKHIKRRFPDVNTYDATTQKDGTILLENSKGIKVAVIMPPSKGTAHEGDDPCWRWKSLLND